MIDKMETSHERPYLDAHNPPLSRRDLFRMATRQGKAALAQTVEQTKNDGQLPGRDRRRILNSISQFPTPEIDSKLSIRDSFTSLIHF